MPKVSLAINDFSGGLVTDVSPRDLEGNQLEYCTNVDPSRKGRLKNSRIFKDDDTNFGDFTSAAHTSPGYGLFVFSNDTEIQSGHAANADDFLVKADGLTIDFQELSDKTITAGDDASIAFGATSATPAFYTAEGDVFVGGDHSTAPSSLVWHYQAKRDRTVEDWISAVQAKTAPTEGVGGDMMVHAADAADASGNTDFTTNEVDKLHWVLDFGADETGGFSNKSDGSGAGTYMEFAGSWLYKNNAESALTSLLNGSNSGGIEWNHSNVDVISATLTVHAEVGAAFSAASDHIYGARLYSRQHLDNIWYLLAELSFEKGIKGSLETEFSEWADSTGSYGHAAEATGAMCTTNPIIDPPLLLTFDTLNGYGTDDIVGTVYWKHGTIANSRAYVGNVKVNGRSYGDRILKSAIVADSAGIANFNYDVFSENAYLDVAINDGDSITALEAYADRLLQFKKKSLYIINISKELEFLEDVRVGAGVDNPAAVTKTAFGVVWANQTGCFLYDGDKISQLHVGKLSDPDWENVTENVIVGYDLPTRQIVVLWNGATAGSGEAFVYTLDTQSWHLVDDMMQHASNVTNMVNTSDGKLLIGAGDSGSDEVSVYADRTGTSQIDMRTGQLSLGNPGSKKNLCNVKIRYKYGGSDLTVSIITNNDSDDTTETTTALTVEADSGEATNYLSEDDVATIHTREFNTLGITALQNQYWFQVKIAGTAHQSFELDEVVLTYRELGVR